MSLPMEAARGAPTRKDLRTWIHGVERMGELRRLDGADWNLEIGAITELAHHGGEKSKALLFDNIKGYPRGYRVVSNTLNSMNRLAYTLNMHSAPTRLDMVKDIKTRTTDIPYIKPTVVKDGPVMENVVEGADIDLWKFPTPKWHEYDGGRYIGTGCIIITRDPDEGWVNLGTYRVMIHDRDALSLYISPGKHGRMMRDKCFSRGQTWKIAIAFGFHPLIGIAGGTEFPYGTSEYDWVGGVQGESVPIIEGKHTGLPFPADAEIVIEGEVAPGDVRAEGPFGEWTGYYSSSTRPEPVVRVKALYHRQDPILLGAPPTRPPCEYVYYRCYLKAALVWRELEAAGVPDVTGVWCHEAGGGRLFIFVSIKQRYAGHARQAGMVAAYCHAGAYMGRYVVVLDDDIDVTNINDVLWALGTRSDPVQDIEIVRRSWSGPLDPIIRKEHKGLSSRAIIDACRPYEWIKEFPRVSESSPEIRAATAQKWGKLIE